MNAESPMLFPTLDKQLNLPPGTVADFSKQHGFPAAGDGVARLSDVAEWVKQNQIGSDAGGGDDPGFFDEPTVAAVAEQPASGELVEAEGVEFITVQLPIMRESSPMPARSQVGFRLRGGDQKIRQVFGDLLAGLKRTKATTADDSVVQNFSDMFRFLGEHFSAAENSRDETS